MAEKQSKDLVITYMVSHGSADAQYPKVKEACEAGYRVVDIIQSACPPGGNSNAYGTVAVTVMLQLEASTGSVYGKVGEKKKLTAT